MLSDQEKKLALAGLPILYRDCAEPFPIKHIGVTVFEGHGRSQSFPGLTLEPRAGAVIIEYALYFDYDIQHLYDLEHIWTEVADGRITDCWCSFHGMRIHAAGAGDLCRWEDGRPVLYIQPGKHALMPDVRLFGLHSQCHTCCRETAGGGLLVPPMLKGAMAADAAQDEAIRSHIRSHYSFTPAWEFVPAQLPSELTDWPALLEAIPKYVSTQLAYI